VNLTKQLTQKMHINSSKPAHFFKEKPNTALQINPISECKHLIEFELLNLLVKQTAWLDTQAQREIVQLIIKSKKHEFYVKNLIHRLEMVQHKIEISTLRYSYKQLKNLSSMVSEFFQNEFNACPDALPADVLNKLYHTGYLSCRLPVISLPSGSNKVKRSKLSYHKWWFKKLNKKINQQRELLKIAIGSIHLNNQKYASNEAVKAYKRRVAAEIKYLSEVKPRNSKTDWNGYISTLRPADQRRFAEFITISKGIEKRADALGLVSSFLTLTLPPEYHSHPLNGDSSKWEGLSPKQSYKKLINIADKLNKVIHKMGLYNSNNFFSIKIVEPHHDGTPHFHIILYYQADYKENIKSAICYQYGDHSFNDKSNLYNLIDIDRTISTPTYYLCKHFMFSNEEKMKNNIRVATNKSIWGMKSFAFSGLPRGAKSIWKLCRKSRFSEPRNITEAKLIKFSCEGDFEKFMLVLESAIKSESITLKYKSSISKHGELIKTVIDIQFYSPSSHNIEKILPVKEETGFLRSNLKEKVNFEKNQPNLYKNPTPFHIEIKKSFFKKHNLSIIIKEEKFSLVKVVTNKSKVEKKITVFNKINSHLKNIIKKANNLIFFQKVY